MGGATKDKLGKNDLKRVNRLKNKQIKGKKGRRRWAEERGGGEDVTKKFNIEEIKGIEKV